MLARSLARCAGPSESQRLCLSCYRDCDCYCYIAIAIAIAIAIVIAIAIAIAIAILRLPLVYCDCRRLRWCSTTGRSAPRRTGTYLATLGSDLDFLGYAHSYAMLCCAVMCCDVLSILSVCLYACVSILWCLHNMVCVSAFTVTTWRGRLRPRGSALSYDHSR